MVHVLHASTSYIPIEKLISQRTTFFLSPCLTKNNLLCTHNNNITISLYHPSVIALIHNNCKWANKLILIINGLAMYVELQYLIHTTKQFSMKYHVQVLLLVLHHHHNNRDPNNK